MRTNLDHVWARVEEAKQRAELYEQGGEPEQALRALEEVDVGLTDIGNEMAALELDLIGLRQRLARALDKKQRAVRQPQASEKADRAHV